MIVSPAYCKKNALKALKGNWQTPMLVLFFSELFAIISEVFNEVTFEEVKVALSSFYRYLYTMINTNAVMSTDQQTLLLRLNETVMEKVHEIPTVSWILLGIFWLVAFIITPALSVSRDHYFVERVDGEEAGLKKGVTSCLPIWGKCLWLNILTNIKVFLWSLLFVIPGIIASIRYSQAPHFLAEDHSISAHEAIERSKKVMNGQKMSYFLLRLSFIGWMLIVSVITTLLGNMNAVIALVAAQFLNLTLNTYIDMAAASFYVTVSRPSGFSDMIKDMKAQYAAMGMDTSEIGEDDIEIPEVKDNDSKD